MKHKPRHAAAVQETERHPDRGKLTGAALILATIVTVHAANELGQPSTRVYSEATKEAGETVTDTIDVIPTPLPEPTAMVFQVPTPSILSVEDLPPLSPELQRIQDIQELIASIDDDYLKKHEGLEGRVLRVKYRSAFVDELDDGRTRLTVYVDSAEPGNPQNEAEFYDFALKSPRETDCDPAIDAAKRRVKKTLRQTLGITVGHDEPGEMHIDRVIISGGQTNCLNDDHPLKSDRPTV